MKTQNFLPHIFALCALTVFVPLGAATSVWSVLILTVLSLALLFVLCKLITESAGCKTAFYIAFFISCAAAVYGAVTTFFDYINFLKLVQLPQTSAVFSATVFSLLIIIFVANQRKAIYKYSLCVAIIATFILIICFLGGIKYFDFSHFKVMLKTSAATPAYYIRHLSVVAAIPLFVFADNKKLPQNTVLGGVVVGLLSLALCTLQSVLTLGGSNYNYPYLYAVSVISSGSLFTRLDGFVYFLFFVFAVIRITICLKIVIFAVKHIFLKQTSYFCRDAR